MRHQTSDWKTNGQQANRRSYPSDISDLQWRFVEILLPEQKAAGRHRKTDLREVINAVNYRWQTGCPWRMLPHDFPPWETVYTYFRLWQKLGLLVDLRDIVIRKRYPEDISRKLSERNRGFSNPLKKAG